MPVVASGPLSTPLATVKTVLAGLASFAQWLGASVDPTTRVYLIEEPTDGGGDKFAVVDIGFDCSREATDIAPGSSFEQALTVLLCFRWVIPAGTSDDDAALGFLNAMGAILPALEPALWNAGVKLQAIRLVAGPERPDTQDRKRRDLYEVVWQLEAKEWPA